MTTTGYKDCDCTTCFEITCGADFCHDCEEAGCDGETECDVVDDSCPGCGCVPGDGITASCNDEFGCGHWKTYAKEVR